MDRTDGYVNASKLSTRGGKEFNQWKRNASSQELMRTLQTQIEQDKDMVLENTQPSLLDSSLRFAQLGARIPNPYSPVCKKFEPGHTTLEDRIIFGTCIHPDLVASIAGWILADFALMVSEVVNGYITQESKLLKPIRAKRKQVTILI